MIKLDNTDCIRLAEKMARNIQMDHPEHLVVKVYGVPRGGIPVSYLLSAVATNQKRILIADDPMGADVIVDDVVDSGRTKKEWMHNTKMPFYALCDYMDPPKSEWVQFPWEEGPSGTNEEDIILRLLQYIGEDPK